MDRIMAVSTDAGPDAASVRSAVLMDATRRDLLGLSSERLMRCNAATSGGDVAAGSSDPRCREWLSHLLMR